MKITDVRIKLMDDPTERLKAFCCVTFDHCFVIRDLKIIEGSHGLFVAMPSRKLTVHCPKCRVKNHVKANYCNQCGYRFDLTYHRRFGMEKLKLYADIAHPINTDCREMIQDAVTIAYEEEKERSLLPGYVCSYDDFYDDETNGESIFFDHFHGRSEPHHALVTAHYPIPESTPSM
ncbi:MAG: SpoVG family protein [Planctomycetaceae bacterium]|nr:SpoVG family protein [Planctomycetaceae bacterium]